MPNPKRDKKTAHAKKVKRERALRNIKAFKKKRQVERDELSQN